MTWTGRDIRNSDRIENDPEHEYVCDKSENSPSEGNNQSRGKRSRSFVIAKVTVCLQKHHECSGAYTDNTGNYKILCKCSCHNTKKQNGIKDSRPTPQSVPEDIAAMTIEGGSSFE